VTDETGVQQSIGMGKAFAGLASSAFAGAVAKIVIRIINVKWPGFLDPDTLDAVGVLVTSGITFAAVYYTPHGGSTASN